MIHVLADYPKWQVAYIIERERERDVFSFWESLATLNANPWITESMSPRRLLIQLLHICFRLRIQHICLTGRCMVYTKIHS